jgi:hypothetical protein
VKVSKLFRVSVLGPLVLLGAAESARCQVTSTQCNLTETLGAAVRGRSYDNRNLYCNIWTLAYWVSPNVTAVTIELDNAQDNNGAPSTWSVVSSTPTTGTNPSVGMSNSVILQFYAPWVSVQITAVTASSGTPSVSYSLKGNFYNSGTALTEFANQITTTDTALTANNLILQARSNTCISVQTGIVPGFSYPNYVRVAQTDIPPGVAGTYNTMGWIYSSSDPPLYFTPYLQYVIVFSNSSTGTPVFITQFPCSLPPYGRGDDYAANATGAFTSGKDATGGAKTAEVYVYWAGTGGAPNGCAVTPIISFTGNLGFGPALFTLSGTAVTPGTTKTFLVTQPIGAYIYYIYTCTVYPNSGTIYINALYK